MKKIIITGLILALGEAAYIFLVASFMNTAGKFLGPDPNILGAVTFLMIFVFSAAVSVALRNRQNHPSRWKGI